jgi:hypothetical protein
MYKVTKLEKLNIIFWNFTPARQVSFNDSSESTNFSWNLKLQDTCMLFLCFPFIYNFFAKTYMISNESKWCFFSHSKPYFLGAFSRTFWRTPDSVPCRTPYFSRALHETLKQDTDGRHNNFSTMNFCKKEL